MILHAAGEVHQESHWKQFVKKVLNKTMYYVINLFETCRNNTVYFGKLPDRLEFVECR